LYSWRCIRLNLRDGTNYAMTLDEKVRYGMMALAGASVVFATLGVHFSPLMTANGYGD
jgi:hypothetical protein